MGHKVLLLAAMGLGALYLMHLLAQDYNKIRKPAMKLAKFLLTKRDVSASLKESQMEDESLNFEINWERVLQNDPLKCAQSLICQIAAGAERTNDEANIISTLVQHGLRVGAPKAIENAHKFGLKADRTFERCYKHYPLCPYSARTMLKILQIHSYLFSA